MGNGKGEEEIQEVQEETKTKHFSDKKITMEVYGISLPNAHSFLPGEPIPRHHTPNSLGGVCHHHPRDLLPKIVAINGEQGILLYGRYKEEILHKYSLLAPQDATMALNQVDYAKLCVEAIIRRDCLARARAFPTNKSLQEHADHIFAHEDSWLEIRESLKTRVFRMRSAQISQSSKIRQGKQPNQSSGFADFCIPRIKMVRVFREIFSKVKPGIRVQSAAIEALRVASEDLLMNIFEDGSLAVAHAKRSTLMLRDIRLVMKLWGRVSPSMRALHDDHEKAKMAVMDSIVEAANQANAEKGLTELSVSNDDDVEADGLNRSKRRRIAPTLISSPVAVASPEIKNSSSEIKISSPSSFLNGPSFDDVKTAFSFPSDQPVFDIPINLSVSDDPWNVGPSDFVTMTPPSSTPAASSSSAGQECELTDADVLC